MMPVTCRYGVRVLSLSALLIGCGATAQAGMSADKQSGMQQDQTQSRSSGQASRQEGGGHWEKMTGTVKKIRSVPLAGMDQENLLAQIETDKGRRVVDLGNTEKLRDLDIQKGDSITVWGNTQKIRGNDVFMARKIKADGDKVFLDRPELTQSSMDQQRGRQAREGQSEGAGWQRAQNRIRGEVIVAGEVVEFDRDTFDRDLFYVIKEPSGRETELIVAQDPGVSEEFNVGDQIEARVKSDGTVTSISRASGDSSRQSESSRQSSGGRSGGEDRQTAQSKARDSSQQ